LPEKPATGSFFYGKTLSGFDSPKRSFAAKQKSATGRTEFRLFLQREQLTRNVVISYKFKKAPKGAFLFW